MTTKKNSEKSKPTSSVKKSSTSTSKSSTKIIHKSPIKKIALLCSGGDSPGMNCAIRAIVRSALNEGIEPWGIRRGYAGLISGDMNPMDVSSVGNILQRGGTILQTSRCPEFHEKHVRKEAFHLLQRKGIDGLVVIGGDGSFKGAGLLYQETGLPIVGIPGTIDNDISGTEYTIGFDTAVQTAVEAVDKIRDTASSHARTFIVEVMGRNSPGIALHVGVCTGAENIIFPYRDIPYQEIVSDVHRGINRGKNSSIIIVAEGESPGLSYNIQKTLAEKYKLKAHVCILGHIQRGGIPTSTDRFIASQMGFMAVKALITGKYPSVTGYVKGETVLVPLEKCLQKRKEYEHKYFELVKTLAI